MRFASKTLLSLVVAGLLPTVARAQTGPAPTLSPADSVARQKLIDDATAAHKAGDHARALELGQKAGALQMTPAVRYFIAQEQEETGALVEAFAGAQRCAREASLDPSVAPAQRELLVSRCQDMQTRLRARVAHIVVRANQVPQGLTVKLSGQTLNRAAIGIPYLVQPGRILVEALAPGFHPYQLDITVSEGQTINVTLQLTPVTSGPVAGAGCPPGQRAGGDGKCISDACRVGMVPAADGQHCCWPGQSFDSGSETCRGTPVCPTPLEARGENCYDGAVAVTGPTGTSGATAVSTSGEPRTASSTRKLGIGGMIAGGVLLAAGTGFWLLSDAHYRSLRDACGAPQGCDSKTYQDGRTNVKRYDRLAVAGLISGAVVALAGGALYAWKPSTFGGERVSLAVDPLARAAAVRVGF